MSAGAAPDLGVDEDIAHLYFRQLISGLVRRFLLPYPSQRCTDG